MTISEVLYRALKKPGQIFWTIPQLSEETGLDREDVKIYLRILNEKSLVQFVNTAEGPSWTSDIAAAHEATREEARRFRERNKDSG